MRITILSLIIACCAACAPAANPAVTVFPTQPPLQGSVTITHPQNGNIIYAEALYVAGTAANIPNEGFRLRVTSALDEEIADVTVQPEGEDWSLEIVHQYTGDPTEMTIVALPLTGTVDNAYAITSAAIAPLTTRPEGTFGTILQPNPASVVGGDVLLVVGTVSGLPGDEARLILAQPDGTPISEVPIIIDHPYAIDEVLWEVNIETNSYTGPALLMLAYDEAEASVELGRVEITLSIVAG